MDETEVAVLAVVNNPAAGRRLAIAIIAGLRVQLPLVLLLMPVLFHLMRDRGPCAAAELG